MQRRGRGRVHAGGRAQPVASHLRAELEADETEDEGDGTLKVYEVGHGHLGLGLG